jgi:hypothetical protein
VDDADHRVAAHLESHEHAEERHAGDERLRAVDGVEDPAEVRVPLLQPVLLAEDRVRGERLADDAPQLAFALAVGDGDGRAVFLRLGRHAVPEVAQHDRARGLRGVHRHLERIAQFRLGVHAPPRFRRKPSGAVAGTCTVCFVQTR